MSYRLRNLAYLFSLSPGLLVIYGNMTGGWQAWLNLFYSLGFLGLLEYFTGVTKSNEHSPAKDPFPEFILYLHVLTHTFVLFSFFLGMYLGVLQGHALIGAMLSTGVAAGSSGIIVAHELIHKASPLKRFLGRYLLASTGNFYFYVHHLRIHHRDVATTQDAATARKGESVYRFFLRSVKEQIEQAAASERKRAGNNWWKPEHEFVKAFILMGLIGLPVLYFCGITGLMAWAGMGLFANFLLEYVNYIEHYGLTRSQGAKITEWHSWSCDKHISRFLLVDLSRHADHHNMASKPYHTLDSYEQGPQLPGGYASLIIPALIPQWWFRITHPLLSDLEQQKTA